MEEVQTNQDYNRRRKNEYFIIVIMNVKPVQGEKR